jgi:hypothetical protein
MRERKPIETPQLYAHQEHVPVKRAHVPDAGSGPVVLGVRVPHVGVPHRRFLPLPLPPPPPQALVRRREMELVASGGAVGRNGRLYSRRGELNPNAGAGLIGPSGP